MKTLIELLAFFPLSLRASAFASLWRDVGSEAIHLLSSKKDGLPRRQEAARNDGWG